MLKHRGFPGRMSSTDFQFVIRRANSKGVTPLVKRERYKDRKHVDRMADASFMAALWDYFGTEPFERGNLDAGRLSFLFGREVRPATDPFDPKSYDALLVIDEKLVRANFPAIFATDAAAGDHDWDADGDDDGADDDDADEDDDTYDDEDADDYDDDGEPA
jgi:hypothetical protein